MKRLNKMDVILIIIAVVLVVFTVVMIMTFHTQGAIPDTLVTCVFAALTGECGFMALIKTTKEKKSSTETKPGEEEKNDL